jgi:hypothetical protein
MKQTQTAIRHAIRHTPRTPLLAALTLSVCALSSSLPLLLCTGPAHALSLKYLTDAEIVVMAGAVVEGRVVRVIPPRRPGVKRAASVAVIQLTRVYKGPLKAGGTLRLLYWSHPGKLPLRWSSPWKYEVGWTGCLALNKRPRGAYSGYDRPRGAAKAKWVHWSPHYRGKVASTSFRQAAAAWKDPIRHLGDPQRRAAALHFLAAQKKLKNDQLLTFLTSKKMADVIAGCRAVTVTRERSAIPALVNLALGKHRPTPGPGPYDTIAGLSRRLGEALGAVGLDPEQDEATLLRLLLEAKPGPRGRFTPSSSINWLGMALQLLRTGGPRKRVTARLAAGLKRAPTPQGIGVLAALDMRLARPLIHAHAKLSGRSWVLREVRTTAHSDLSSLRARLGKHKHWTVFATAEQRYRVVPRGKLPALRRSITQHLSPPTPQQGPVDAAWIVDIYSKKNWKGFERLPRAQLYVARDGSFSFSWAPDERQGRSPALARLLAGMAR